MEGVGTEALEERRKQAVPACERGEGVGASRRVGAGVGVGEIKCVWKDREVDTCGGYGQSG